MFAWHYHHTQFTLVIGHVAVKILQDGRRQLDGNVLEHILQRQIVDEEDAVALQRGQLLVQQSVHGGADSDARVAARLAIGFGPLADVEQPVEGRWLAAQVAQQLDYLLLLGQRQVLDLVDVTHQAMILAVLVQDEHHVLLQGGRLQYLQRQQRHIRRKLALATARKGSKVRLEFGNSTSQLTSRGTQTGRGARHRWPRRPSPTAGTRQSP